MLVLTLSFLLQLSTISPGPVESPEAGPEAGIAALQSSPLAAIRTAIVAGRLEEASTLLQIFDLQHPDGDREELALLRGELAVEKGLPLDAERLVAAVDGSGALHCEVERIRGLALAERGEGAVAIDRLGAVVETCAPDWRVWNALGKLFADRGEREASRFAFANALDASGNRPRVQIDFARALIKLGDPLAATDELQTAIRGNPQDQEVRQLLDFVTGLRGLEPERAAGDTDERWAGRLADAAQGAEEANRKDLARALFARALLLSPRYDQRLLSQAAMR